MLSDGCEGGQPWADAFMALFGRDRLPARSTLSRFLASLDQAAVEALRTLFLKDLLARPLGKEERAGGLWDRQGNRFFVFDVDGTREAARQRALPKGDDLPPAYRRLDEICAPGYTGRKRGEVVRTRTTVLQMHTHQWLGSFGNRGNGRYREELHRAKAVVERYLAAHQWQPSRTLRLGPIWHQGGACGSGRLLFCHARQGLHGVEIPAEPASLAPPQVGQSWKASRFSGQDFVPQPDGMLRCPADQTLVAHEQRREVDGSLRVVYGASIRSCRPCPLREQCQWNGAATNKPRQVSVLLHPLVVGEEPLLWRDWSRRVYRQACMQLLRHQRVEVEVESRNATLVVAPAPLSRAERVHYRFGWAERLARNARALTTECASRRHNDANKVKQEIEQQGRKAITIAGDVGDERFCQQAVQQTIEQLGHLDILVNNAGEQYAQASIEEISAEQLERTFRTNIFAQFFMTKAAVKHLRSGGAIINTTSVNAYKGNAHLLDFAATKGAIVSFTRSLSEALVEKGIRVNAVAPEPIWTPLIPSTMPPEQWKSLGLVYR